MRPKRRQSRRNAGEGVHILGAVVLFSLIAAAAGFTGWQYWSRAVSPELDAKFCPADGPRAIVAFIIDGTDNLPELAIVQAQRRIQEEAESLKEHGLFEIRAVNPEQRGGTVVFSMCSRGDGSGLSKWTHNPELMERRWQKEFAVPLGEALKKPFSGEELPSSPIMETIQAFAVEWLDGKKARDIPKRLFIVSDMLQHSGGYSHYSGNFSYEKFQQTDFYRSVKTNLHGTEVRIFYVQRRTKTDINSARHAEFWAKWVRDNKGVLKEAIKLQGLD